MNLVAFDSGSRKLLLSRHLWLYFVISIPLTIVTLVCWKWNMSRRDEVDDDDYGGDEKSGQV